MALLNTLTGPDHPSPVPAPAPAALPLLPVLLGPYTRSTAAPDTAVLRRLLLNDLAVPPAGTLTWTGHRDTFCLTCPITDRGAGLEETARRPETIPPDVFSKMPTGASDAGSIKTSAENPQRWTEVHPQAAGQHRAQYGT
ncbi:hypothetical protein [Streptomyces sp. NBC_00986]|uniref:hypothetical protein n=1 Tax=Streptomyces sp. NBC_00986 TaxID=2903702 RepID=UPI0038640707|nr:hypothetical protein OG504_00605 [Streptomyces sp. NBC_00986]